MNPAIASSPAAYGKSEEEQKAITPQIREDVIGSSPATDSQDLAASPNIGAKGQVKSFQFWAVIAALSLTGLLAALESTVITSALPTIINTLGGGKNYVWIPNSYLLASIAILPFVAQVSDIFGRRWPMLGAVALFIFGSGLSGGASSVGMLIAGRTVQGFGGGGITLLIETVVTDLVPLRERGKYMAITLLGSILGTAGGAFIGGLIVERSTWRWIFYLNLPNASLAFILLFVFLRVNYPRAQTWRQRLAKIDATGNAIFSATIISVLIALTWAGTIYDWNNFHIIVPLVLGFLGVGVWITFEWTVSKEPSFPRKIVSNRTSAAVLGITLLHSLVIYWGFYFLPVYFQAVKAASPFRAGVLTLPYVAGLLPIAVVGGGLLSKWGRYKPLHLIGWAFLTISCGLFTLLDNNSSMAAFVCFQLVFAAGSGLLAVVLLPAMQAPLDESLVALTTGIWTFSRLFGGIWGVAVPSVIFNNQCSSNAERMITDPAIQQVLMGGSAYAHAAQSFLNSIEDPVVRAQVITVFAKSMRTVWYSALAFALVGFLVTFIEKEVSLRNELKSEYVLEENKKVEIHEMDGLATA